MGRLVGLCGQWNYSDDLGGSFVVHSRLHFDGSFPDDCGSLWTKESDGLSEGGLAVVHHLATGHNHLGSARDLLSLDVQILWHL